MTRDELNDGKRIAELLASEIEGGGGLLSALSVSDADPAVDPTPDGAFAYRVTQLESQDEADVSSLAEVYVQPDRTRVEFAIHPEAAATAARAASLRVRPKAVVPPRTLVFVESGAEVKRVRDVFEAVTEATVT